VLLHGFAVLVLGAGDEGHVAGGAEQGADGRCHQRRRGREGVQGRRVAEYLSWSDYEVFAAG